MSYNVESLERGIEAARKNIKVFEDAIDKERDTIKEYRFMMEVIEKKANEAKKIKIDAETGSIEEE